MGTFLQTLPKGRPLLVAVSTKLVELAPRNMARTIEKVSFGIWDPSGRRAKIAHTTLKSSWEPHGLTEVLAFLSRLLSSNIELRRLVPLMIQFNVALISLDWTVNSVDRVLAAVVQR